MWKAVAPVAVAIIIGRGLAGLHPLLLLLAIMAMTVFLSELTSNTAQVATMMPVGTPPNAIVLGTGLVRMPQMMKAGF